MKKSPIFLALDDLDYHKAIKMSKLVKPNIGGIKVGLEFWYRFSKLEIINLVEQIDLPLFLDLKLHDIPKTVENAIKYVLELKPLLTTIHAAGGSEMIRAACEITKEISPKTKVITVTMLTSLSDDILKQFGFNLSAKDYVLNLAKLALEAKAGGVVCSPHEIQILREQLGNDYLIVTPGIRMSDASKNDQRRTLSPSEAIKYGANYLVIGRPITKSSDPLKSSEDMLNNIFEATNDRL